MRRNPGVDIVLLSRRQAPRARFKSSLGANQRRARSALVLVGNAFAGGPLFSRLQHRHGERLDTLIEVALRAATQLDGSDGAETDLEKALAAVGMVRPPCSCIFLAHRRLTGTAAACGGRSARRPTWSGRS